MSTILITGGTGLIGTELTKTLTASGHEVIILTRTIPKEPGDMHTSYALWNPEKELIDEDAIRRADHIIHLAGANVGEGRWTKKRKMDLLESRVQTGRLLVNALKRIPNKVQSVVSASAIGYYGADKPGKDARPFIESDPPSTDFLGTVAKEWEQAIKPVRDLGKRLVILRIGIVLAREGGAYPELRKTLDFGLASILGSGKQMVSWIHILDLVSLLLMAVNNDRLEGVYNAVTPDSISNKDLVLAIARQRHRFYIPIHVPSFVLKTILGEMSIEVLKSARVSSLKIGAEGFHFQYPTIQEAAKELELR